MYFDRKLWAMMAGQRLQVALGVLLGLAGLAVGILRFVFLGQFLAGVFAGDARVWPLVAAALAVLARAALEYARAAMAHTMAARMQAQLRARVLEKAMALGPAWFGAERTGGVMLAMVDGVEQLQTFFGQYLPQLVIAAAAPVMIFLFMAYWDVPVASVLLVAALITLVLPLAAHRKDKAASLARSRAFKSFGEEFLDAVQGLPTLKAFGQSRAYGEMLARKARELSASTMWVLAMSVITRGITDCGIAIGAAVALILGAWRVTHGEMSLEALLIVLMAGTEIFRPLRDLRSVLHQGMQGQSAAMAINALLDEPVAAPAAPARPVETAGLAPTIVFENVTFEYAGGRGAAHRGLDFSVGAGERVGFVGPSGAGKSTIVRLLLRLHDPQAGAVRVGGVDVRELDPEALRRMIAVVAQDTYLFHGTVEENLRLGRPEASHEEIVAAARAANAHEFISALPQGYATVIGERGALLSGGQRQRIAIARALLRDTPILVLDEALSSVDAENEAVIQQALERLMVGRTTLILAHRLSSVINADRILVIDDGAVAQVGTHAALIGVAGPYRDLMGPQVAQGGTAPVVLAAPKVEAAAETGAVARSLADDAAHVGWPETIRSLLGFIVPWRRTLGVVVLCGISRVAAFIGVGVLGALLIGAVKAGDLPVWLAVALLVAAPAAGILHWAESWLAHAMAYDLLAEMRIALFEKLDRLAPSYLLQRRSGDLLAVAAQDVETVEYFYAHTVAPAAIAVLVPSTVLAVLALLAWPLALALLPFLLYAAASPFLGRARIDREGSAARGALGGLAAFATETIQGMAELLAFQATQARAASFAGLTAKYQELRLGLLRDLSWQSAGLEVATGLGGLAVAALGAVLVARGSLAAETLPVLVLISVAAFLPVSEIAQVGRQLADTIASTRRLHVVHAEPEKVRDGSVVPAAPVGGSAIGFDGVGFTYPGRSVPALQGVSFAIAPGSTVALVGPSGAGKTTVANLLLRFWDVDAGAIRLDGVDLRDLTLDGLRGRIALVAQDTYLFNDTLEKNIRLARPEATEAELHLALERAALGDFVRRLPDGLATRVGERGVQLSGGQRQRIAIARAFLKDSPVLVLDEATSHLDTISEQLVRGALDGLMQDRTTIVIAHRLSTIQAADQILVLQAGRLAEAGTHAQLLAQGGVYARLVGQQTAANAAQ